MVVSKIRDKAYEEARVVVIREVGVKPDQTLVECSPKSKAFYVLVLGSKMAYFVLELLEGDVDRKVPYWILKVLDLV